MRKLDGVGDPIADYDIGDVVTLYDGDRVLVTEREADLKNGRPGGYGITQNNPERRSLLNCDADYADRWFYDFDVRATERRATP